MNATVHILQDVFNRMRDGWYIKVFPSRHRPNKDKAYMYNPDPRLMRQPIRHIPLDIFREMFNLGIIEKHGEDGQMELYRWRIDETLS